MQEQIERESVAVSLKATKLTSQVLAAALKKVCGTIKNRYNKAQTAHGSQSVKQLMNHNCPTSTIPIEGDKGLFEKIARKWHVDYAFHQTGENEKTGEKQYLLLFKSGQADSITAAFTEYSKEIMKRAKDKRPPVMDEAKKAKEQVKRAERANPVITVKKRTKEVSRE
jgi:hypothetical protein